MRAFFLALVAAVLRVYHRAGRTEGSAVIKWNADHLSTVSHNPTAYLTSLPSGVLNSGCIADKRNTDDNPKFHHRAHRPWQQRRLHHCRKALEITVTYRPRLSCFLHWFGRKSTGCISESVKGCIMLTLMIFQTCSFTEHKKRYFEECSKHYTTLAK